MLGRFNKKHVLTVLFGGIIVFSAFNTINNYMKNEPDEESMISSEFYRFLEGKEIERGKEVLISMPQHALYTKTKTKMMYYPLFTPERIKDLTEYTQKKKDSIQYILLDTGEGGTMCNPYLDSFDECSFLFAEFIESLKENYKIEYYSKIGNVEYFIFSN